MYSVKIRPCCELKKSNARTGTVGATVPAGTEGAATMAIAHTARPAPAQRRAIAPQGGWAGRIAASPTATTMR